jgi:carbon monoxide dehydrogenase subunit G
MELTNEFEVAVPVERAWAVLTDLERIAPCLPGAQLREVQGDEYRGSVKIKVGPITTSYDGVIRITELDLAAHRAVLKAEGRETRGQGNVASVITATLSSTPVGTKVTVLTDLTITGKVAQFGRGVLADVSAKLLDQFVANLEATVLVPDDEATSDGATASDPADAAPKKKRTAKTKAPVDESPTPGSEETAESDVNDVSSEDARNGASEVRHINSEAAEPVDLIDVAGGSIARRVIRPLVVTGFVLVFLVRRVRRHKK